MRQMTSGNQPTSPERRFNKYKATERKRVRDEQDHRTSNIPEKMDRRTRPTSRIKDEAPENLLKHDYRIISRLSPTGLSTKGAGITRLKQQDEEPSTNLKPKIIVKCHQLASQPMGQGVPSWNKK